MKKLVLAAVFCLSFFSAANAAENFVWDNPGQNKFGKRDFSEAVEKFLFPAEVKISFEILQKYHLFRWGEISPGDRFEQMIFGDYKIAENVLVKLPPGKALAAKIYSAEYGGKKYILADPLICHNLCWRVEPVVIAPPPPPAAEKITAASPPPPAAEKAEKITIEPAKKYNFRPDMDISTGVFSDRHRSGNEPRGWWGVGNFYLFNIEEVKKIQSFGFSVEGNRWSGTTGDEYDYFGKRYAVDAAYRLLTPNSELNARLGFGKVNDWGHIETAPSGRYESDQDSEIITAYCGYEKTNNKKFLHRMRYYAQGDWNIDRDKTDRWVDGNGVAWPLNGEASNKSMLNAGIDGSVRRLNGIVSLACGADLMYYQEESKTGLRLSPGLDFFCKKTLVGGLRVSPTYWSDSDHAIGVSAFLDLTNIVRSIWPNFLPSTSVGEKWDKNIPVQSEHEKIIMDILK